MIKLKIKDFKYFSEYIQGTFYPGEVVDLYIEEMEETLSEKDNEIARLRKMISKNHHAECTCSFCRGAGFVYGGDK